MKHSTVKVDPPVVIVDPSAYSPHDTVGEEALGAGLLALEDTAFGASAAPDGVAGVTEVQPLSCFAPWTLGLLFGVPAELFR